MSPPPRAATTNITPAPSTVTPPPTAAIATRSAVSAVATLSSLPPDRTVIILRGSPSSRPTAVAATASGGATIAPRANPAASGRPGTSAHATKPTAAVVASTSPTDSRVIDRSSLRKPRTELCQAAAYSSGGTKKNSTSSGLSSYSGNPGTFDTASPTRTRTIGAETRVRSASPATTTAPTSSANIAAMADRSRCTAALLRVTARHRCGETPGQSLPGGPADREPG